MLIIVHSKRSSNILALPEEVLGAHAIVDSSGRTIVWVSASAGQWRFAPARGVSIAGDKHKKSFDVDPQGSLVFALEDGQNEWTVICRPNTEGDKTTDIVGFSADAEISIGRSEDNVMVYASQFVSAHHACLSFRQGSFSIQDLGSANGVFVNGVRIDSGSSQGLKAGDAVSVLGLTLVVGKDYISFNHPGDNLTLNMQPGFVAYQPPKVSALDRDELEVKPKYFYPALRFPRYIEAKEFVVDAPPQKEKEDETPLLMRIGPSLVMALAAIMSAAVSVSYMMGQDGGMLRSLPMVCMAAAMLAGSVIWPVFSKRFETKKSMRQEALRKGAYSEYLGKIRGELLDEMNLQSEILRENIISSQECLVHAKDNDAFFMSRMPLHKDYLELRLGTGDVPLKANIRFPDQRFSVEEDELRDVVNKFAKEPNILHDVPIGFSLVDTPALGIVGSKEKTDAFCRSIIIQLAALHAYDRVKIAFLCDSDDQDSWGFLKCLPHVFDDNEEVRFFASSLDEANELGMMFERVIAWRANENSFNAREAKPYFVVFCTSKEIYDKADFVSPLLSLNASIGFSFIATAEHMHQLPQQCARVLDLDGPEGPYLINRDDVQNRRIGVKLDPWISIEEAELFSAIANRARLDVGSVRTELPDSLGFLEMFDVSQVEHLNVYSRWKENSGAVTLAVQIGIDQLGDPFMLNLHEKFHGPHGLIAGTTGSGKSEFIISYILSMAANYSPDDVAFVLIDYKGGGLATAFENERFVLPHLAGTITNLDGAAIARSLISIKSELQRRQRLFNEAREAAGGDNVDIYRYLDMYRQGRVTEKCPHLIIVADEFAELKQQEPEFMDELVSAARIGRSLGVHLILATQKPSGVVNDQIWSNARFKISLKVADEADSKEVIRTADAASIKQPGRFYLMVGYNEMYSLGQSGYSGGSYAPGRVTSRKDTSVEYIGNTGRTLLSVKPRTEKTEKSGKSELVALAEHIVDVARQHDCSTRPLWLPPLAERIHFGELVKKYSWESEDDFGLSAVVGEVDIPALQEQRIFTVSLLQGGNLVLYGGAEAGAEEILQTMLYSLVTVHSPQTLNAYVLDFGSQALAAFAQWPQVGDVILPAEEEKVRRFFEYMFAIIAQRRDRFAEYGGSFERYCSDHSDCPSIVVIINGVAALMDMYQQYEEHMYRFLRESASVGIRVIATADNVSAMRMRMRNSFRQVLSCELVDESDYSTLFGSMRGRVIPRGFGRGIVKVEDDVLLFQAASVTTQGESSYRFISEEGSMQAVVYEDTAPSIPVAPSMVSPQMLSSLPAVPQSAPFGIYDDTLGSASFVFDESPLARCVFQKRKLGANFMGAFVAATVARGEWDVCVLDIAEYLEAKPCGCVIATRKPEAAAVYLEDVLARKEQRGDKPTLLIVSGMSALVRGLEYDLSTAFKNWLRALRHDDGFCLVLFDTLDTADYTYEDWFKAHMTNREGLWIGPGADSQTNINMNYNAKLRNNMPADKAYGYMTEAGDARLVHVVKLDDTEEA